MSDSNVDKVKCALCSGDNLPYVTVETYKGFEVWRNLADESLVAVFTTEYDVHLFLDTKMADDLRQAAPRLQEQFIRPAHEFTPAYAEAREMSGTSAKPWHCKECLEFTVVNNVCQKCGDDQRLRYGNFEKPMSEQEWRRVQQNLGPEINRLSQRGEGEGWDSYLLATMALNMLVAIINAQCLRLNCKSGTKGLSVLVNDVAGVTSIRIQDVQMPQRTATKTG